MRILEYAFSKEGPFVLHDSRPESVAGVGDKETFPKSTIGKINAISPLEFADGECPPEAAAHITMHFCYMKARRENSL